MRTLGRRQTLRACATQRAPPPLATLRQPETMQADGLSIRSATRRAAARAKRQRLRVPRGPTCQLSSA